MNNLIIPCFLLGCGVAAFTLAWLSAWWDKRKGVEHIW